MQPEKVSSCLTVEKRGMDRIMLEVVAAGLVKTPVDIKRFIEYTLLAADYEAACMEEKGKAEQQLQCGDNTGELLPAVQQHDWRQLLAVTCKTSIKNLADQGFVLWKAQQASEIPPGTGDETDTSKKQAAYCGEWVPHKLAAAALRANISPEEALMLSEDVNTVAKQLCLESDLHLMYLVAPVKANEMLKWQLVYSVVSHAHTHNPVMQTVCQRSGVDMELARRLGQGKRIGYKPEVRPLL
jgi:hypothetical protein